MKVNRNKVNIIIIILGILALFLIEEFRPKPIDWSQSYERAHKTPFGCFVLYDFLEDIFPGKEIIENKQSLYETFRKTSFIDERNSNLIIITDLLQIDRFTTSRLVAFAERGNNVFIAAHDLNKELKDTLKVQIQWSWSEHPQETQKTMELMFLNPNINSDTLKYSYSRALYNFHITSFDTANTQILGKSASKGINFIKISVGKGYFFINSSPMAFSNINLTEAKNHGYAFTALSHLPIRKTFWDEFYKPMKKYTASSINYILSQPALKTAYILLMAALIIFIVFEAKRKQRHIPIINPKTNSTLDFVEAVSRMYFYKRNHKDLATKKYLFLLEQIRSKYYLKTTTIDEDFINNLSYKTGIDTDDLKELFSIVNQLLAKSNINEPELHRINNLIENFYQKTTY